MFRRLLIANRGEVAVRIARACRELGVAPVGVVSAADRDAAWTRQMDEVVCLGPSAARQSYLDRESVVQAALQTRCAAVHPGWGFLAEDPLFAALCAQHGLSFVGPSALAIETMGIKSSAKQAMRAAGLDVIPGSDGVLESVEQAAALARDFGYPVLLKADSGGGGRGMRRCADEAELREGYASATAEAESAFGNGALYLEKYLDGGRHIEIQVLADAFGDAVHLFERECSIQRKHQKLIEEAPSPVLDDATRRELGLRSAQAAREVAYRGAGTIEFLRSDDGPIYFMEMNTRLQVEHPVTEMITGTDIAAAQIAVAAHRSLAALELRQDALRIEGAAIECRINAEDPTQDFRPTPGVLSAFELPDDKGPGRVRVETHLAEGEEVSPYYDSLIAKVIAWGEDRNAAIETMLATLRATRVEGVSTTIPLHLAVLDSPEFRAGNYDTRSLPGWST